MKALKRKWVTVLLIGALGAISLFPDAGMGAGATKFMKDLRGETVLLPPSAPERERLTLVSFVNVISEAEIVGAVALYDDPRTEAATDYMEIINFDLYFCFAFFNFNFYFDFIFILSKGMDGLLRGSDVR